MSNRNYNEKPDNVVKTVMYAVVLSVLFSSITQCLSPCCRIKYCSLFRALSVLLFCSGYFGDEWLTLERKRRFSECCKGISLKLFPFDFLGWLFFALQACSISSNACFTIFGTVATLCVSINLNMNEAKLFYGPQIDDWLYENSIWLTWMILLGILPFDSTFKAEVLLVVSLVIFMIKFSQWFHYKKSRIRRLVWTILIPLSLLLAMQLWH